MRHSAFALIALMVLFLVCPHPLPAQPATSGTPAIYVNPQSLTITQSAAAKQPQAWIEYVPGPGAGQAKPAGSMSYQHGLGAVIPPSIQEFWVTHAPQLRKSLAGLPQSIDWSGNDSPVKNQGNCGSCWAFAATAFIENVGSQTDLAEQVLVSCIPGSNCNGGSYFAALNYYRDVGVPGESCDPYAAVNGSCSSECAQPPFLERATSVVDAGLWGSPAVLNDVRTALQTGPLVVYMRVPTDNSFYGYSGGIYHYTGGTISSSQGHAVLIVGYNDTQQCFKVKNSWGTFWGEAGYFRISYADLNNGTVFGSYATTAAGIYTQTIGTNAFVIENIGTSPLTVSGISANKTWLSVSGSPATPFSIATGGSGQTVTAVVNWSLVPGASDVGTIAITSNDPNTPTVTVQVTVNKTTPTRVSLTLKSSPTGAGTVTPSPTPDADGKYSSNTVVTLTPVPAANYSFMSWSDSLTGSANPGQVTLNHDKVVTANFATIAWQAVVTVSDGCSGSAGLTFGLAPTASDGIDASLGEAELPPPPPGGSFDSRFLLPVTPSVASLKDYRSSTLTSATWRMTFQPSACGYPLTFAWNPSTLPAGGVFTLKDEVTGSVVNVDMRGQSSYTLTNSGITSLRIDYSPGMTVNVQVSAGWNLISAPVRAPDSSVSTLFPAATTPAYGYNNGYVTALTLSVGKGYWLKFANAATVPIFGVPVSPRNIAVASGWNIIGPFEVSAATSGITSTPSGIIATPFYGFSNGYVTSTTLTPGQGYWVKTTQAGTLIFPGTGSPALAKPPSPQEPASSSVAITVQDNSGTARTLYLTQDGSPANVPELPPVPPSGILDVRFSGNTSVETVDGARHEIRISSAVYPLTVQAANLSGKTFLLKDGIDGKLLNEPLGEGRVITILSKISSLLLVRGSGTSGEAPAAFNLSQNYPNPFNPTTVIQFALPKASKVRLTVYNVLGEMVRELANGDFEAGEHSIQFNADGFASGVYFCRLEAGTFTAIKRMALMK